MYILAHGRGDRTCVVNRYCLRGGRGSFWLYKCCTRQIEDYIYVFFYSCAASSRQVVHVPRMLNVVKYGPKSRDLNM